MDRSGQARIKEEFRLQIQPLEDHEDTPDQKEKEAADRKNRRGQNKKRDFSFLNASNGEYDLCVNAARGIQDCKCEKGHDVQKYLASRESLVDFIACPLGKHCLFGVKCRFAQHDSDNSICEEMNKSGEILHLLRRKQFQFSKSEVYLQTLSSTTPNESFDENLATDFNASNQLTVEDASEQTVISEHLNDSIIQERKMGLIDTNKQDYKKVKVVD